MPSQLEDHALAGQILLAPFLENFESLLRCQAETVKQEIAEMQGIIGTLMRFFVRISGDPTSRQSQLINRVKTSTKPTFKVGKQVINAKWIRELIAADPIAIHTAVIAPTLAIGVSKDIQCLSEDVSKLGQVVSGPIETLIINEL